MLQDRLGMFAGGYAGTFGQARSSERFRAADADPDPELRA
jgi:hypothetical protein